MTNMATDDNSGGDPPRMDVIEGGRSGVQFNQFLQRIQYGEFNGALTRDLEELGAAMTRYSQEYQGQPKGTIEIKLKFELKKGVVEVTAEKKLTVPKMPAHGGVFYLDAQSRLVEQDPRQLSMFPRGPRGI